VNLPDYPDGILLEHRVSGDDRPVFFHALRNQHAIDGRDDGGEAIESEQVIKGDWEMLNPVFRQFAQHVWTGRPRERQLADCTLIRISQILAMLSERSAGPAKMSRARRDILGIASKRPQDACVSRGLFISEKEVRFEQVLNSDRDH